MIGWTVNVHAGWLVCRYGKAVNVKMDPVQWFSGTVIRSTEHLR